MAAVLPPLHPIHLVQSLTRVVGTFVPPPPPPPPFPSWAERRGPSGGNKQKTVSPFDRPSDRPSIRCFDPLTPFTSSIRPGLIHNTG